VGQAKTFTEAELKQVLAFIATQPHAARNRAMVLMTFWGGLRVGELAQLRYGDAFDAQHQARAEIRLDPAITKGRHARTVFVAQKLRVELKRYARLTRAAIRAIVCFRRKSTRSAASRPTLARSTS
jgi:integrase/recombinase XerD